MSTAVIASIVTATSAVAAVAAAGATSSGPVFDPATAAAADDVCTGAGDAACAATTDVVAAVAAAAVARVGHVTSERIIRPSIVGHPQLLGVRMVLERNPPRIIVAPHLPSLHVV